jgi:hypothetical protein
VPTLGAPKPSHPQVVEDGTGHLFFAWDETSHGVRAAAMTDATADAAGTLRFSSPASLAPGGPTQYPVMAPLARGVIVAWTSGPSASSAIGVGRRYAGGARPVAAARPGR